MTQNERNGLRLMEQIGGGFASNLAKAWQRADGGNQARLQAAFGDILAEYAALAEKNPDAVKVIRSLDVIGGI